MNVAYFTDVEGQWAKFEGFLSGNPWVRWQSEGKLAVAPGARLVFGGDAIDRGSGARRLLTTLLDVKKRQPEQVVLIAGNRDINKLRLHTELSGEPLAQTPNELRSDRVALLRWIFAKTMGAPEGFTHRAQELEAEGQPHDDDAVVDSFVEDVRPGGLLADYLAHCQLAHREDETLFVHGGVTEQSLGHVPGHAPLAPAEVDAWVGGLNTFYRTQLEAFLAGERGYADVIAYQAPVPKTKQNQASVVYGRLTDAFGNPHLPRADVIASLAQAGVRRVVVGHTPSGDCPTLVRDGSGFELIMADNSYAPVEYCARVLLGEQSRVTGYANVNGARRSVFTPLDADNTALGLRDNLGRLLKAQLDDGAYLTFRSFEGYKSEQFAVHADELPRPLQPAWT